MAWRTFTFFWFLVFFFTSHTHTHTARGALAIYRTHYTQAAVVRERCIQDARLALSAWGTRASIGFYTTLLPPSLSLSLLSRFSVLFFFSSSSSPVGSFVSVVRRRKPPAFSSTKAAAWSCCCAVLYSSKPETKQRGTPFPIQQLLERCAAVPRPPTFWKRKIKGILNRHASLYCLP